MWSLLSTLKLHKFSVKFSNNIPNSDPLIFIQVLGQHLYLSRWKKSYFNLITKKRVIPISTWRNNSPYTKRVTAPEGIPAFVLGRHHLCERRLCDAGFVHEVRAQVSVALVEHTGQAVPVWQVEGVRRTPVLFWFCWFTPRQAWHTLTESGLLVGWAFLEEIIENDVLEKKIMLLFRPFCLLNVPFLAAFYSSVGVWLIFSTE